MVTIKAVLKPVKTCIKVRASRERAKTIPVYVETITDWNEYIKI